MKHLLSVLTLQGSGVAEFIIISFSEALTGSFLWLQTKGSPWSAPGAPWEPESHSVICHPLALLLIPCSAVSCNGTWRWAGGAGLAFKCLWQEAEERHVVWWTCTDWLLPVQAVPANGLSSTLIFLMFEKPFCLVGFWFLCERVVSSRFFLSPPPPPGGICQVVTLQNYWTI